MRSVHDRSPWQLVSGRSSRLLRWLFLVALLVAVQTSSGSEACAQERVVVLVVRPENAEILARLWGQLRDLPVDVRIVDALAAESSPEGLRALLTERGALAAVWFRPARDGQGYEVSVADAGRGEIHTRELQPSSARDGHDALSQSATFEQLAIVVRGELSLLLTARRERRETEQRVTRSDDRQAGTQPLSPSAREHDTGPAGNAGSSALAQGGNVAPASSTESGLRTSSAPLGPVRLSAAWELALAGGNHVANGAAIRCGLGLGSLEVALAAVLGVPTLLTSAAADARVARHSLELALLLGVPVSAALHLSVGAHAGLLAFSRSTRVHDANLATTSGTTPMSAALGPELLLRMRVSPAFGIELALRADFLTTPPRYAVEYGGKTLEVAQERLFEPALRLGVFWAF